MKSFSHKIFFAILAIFVFGCINSCNHSKLQKEQVLYSSEQLIIQQIAEGVYIHKSYLHSPSFGKVQCNGLIYVDHQEAIVFDTPVDTSTALELLGWIKKALASKTVAIVINHFHIDCLGGLTSFHKLGVPSYANQETIDLAIQKGHEIPMHDFMDSLKLRVGTTDIHNYKIGEAHTVDNIISYIPRELVIFGGCMIKCLGAGKGNLTDANVKTWSETVSKVKMMFPEECVVVPGHGKHGGTELLDYTIKLFKN